jgi:hypothetical protein
MTTTRFSITSEVMRFYETLMFELPKALVMDLNRKADMKRLRRAAWTLYDSWIRLTNEASNALYADPAFGCLAGDIVEAALFIRRPGTAISTTIVANLWPSLELPMAQDLRRMRDHVAALRSALQAGTVRFAATRASIGPIANGVVQADNDGSQAATSERLEARIGPLCNQEINSNR